MKKKLTMIFTALFLVMGTAWAQFAPEPGKMYALKESTSGLYLDIQTLGINEANAGATTNNISLNAKPCIIYFDKGTTDNAKWTLKNVNGTYAMQASSRNWNAVIGTTAYEWTISEPETGHFTIARADGKFISVDNAASGAPLFCDKGTGLKFALIEYSSSLTQGYYALKSETGTYFSFTKHSSGTEASFQETPSYLYMIPSADIFMFEDKDNAGSYICSATSGWNVTKETASLWTISEADENGYVTITRHSDATKNLGSDQNTNVGTGIFTNVGSGCNKWLLEGLIDYATTAAQSNGQYHFKSGNIRYENSCNTLRFTLTESGAYYKNGAKRMSLDLFELFDAQGNKVELKETYFTGNYNKSYAGLLDGVNAGAEGAGCCCGAWNSAAEGDDYFEIALPDGVDLGGAFSFSFVTENTTMNAKAFRIDFWYEQREEVKYTFAINAPEGKEFTVRYNNEDIAVGTELDNDFDTELFAATEIPGYTWSIVVDEESHAVTLVYKAVEIVNNPDAVVALVNRIGGTGTADKFKFVLDPSLNSKQEVFVLGSEDGKILVKGTTISAITTGLGWYLNHIAHINISWNSLNEKTVAVKNEGAAYADLSELPLPTVEETHVSDAKYRYYLNTCAFGYSMTSWTWTRWQQEIDWMALHGINMPLQLVGLEEVWRKFLTMEEGGKRKYGYTDTEAKAFVAGPAFIAWWAMNNLEGWGGTGSGTKSGGTWAGAGGVQDDAWYVRQKELAGKITAAQRALGMQPVLPGWSGMVPTNFASKSGYATRNNGGNWAGDFVRPLLLSVSNADYAEIAADYYECLHAVMGESQYYSMDPFHEGGGAGTMEDYEALYAAMEAAKPGSQWVIQQWQWSATQRYSLTAVPAGRLIVLDLFSDGSPAFDSYNGYAPQEAVFCAIPNFGGRSGLMGRLQNVTDNYFKFKEKYASIKGIGAAPEAIEQTPVTYDLIFQLPWMNGVKPDVAAWVDNYAIARYGQDNAVVKEAWSLLRQGPLNYGADGIQGPVEDVWAARPNLDAKPASAWGKTINQAGGIYTRARRQMLIDATYKLLSQHEALGLAEGSVYESNYNYDLVEFIGAVMADYAYDLLLGIKEKQKEGMVNPAWQFYLTRRDGFLNLLLDVDAFKGTNLNFRLGKWTQEARDAAAEVKGATTATADWYEFNNARTIVSTWSTPGTNLNDYSYRSWQGLIKDLYYPRWKYFFDHECKAGEYQFFEWNWAHGMTHEVGQTTVSTTRLTEGEPGYAYTREPEGNTVEKAKEILDKYILPLQIGDSTYYAYRHLNNDLTPMITVVAEPGETIDVSPYFISLNQVHVYGDFIDHEENRCADLSQIPVKSDIADGVYIATVDLNDGTMLEFAVVINPAYYGVYNINYKDGDKDAPVFVGYNEDKDNSNNVGYKLIAEGPYSADALADKMFTIVPKSTGYSISAQGKYLKQPNLSYWNHIMFSDNAAEAGAYIFEETAELSEIFKIHSTGTGINYVNDYDKLVFGNDKSDKENLATFTLSQVESYPLTVSSAGMATLCLPFNVVLPPSMTAYDFASTNVMEEGEGAYICIMQSIAGGGNTLKAGTPVIVKAEPGDYDLKITMEGSGAKTSLPGSLLRGNFMKQELVQGTDVKKFILTKDKNDVVGFYRMQDSGTIGANKCWMEWTTPEGQAEARSFRIRFEQGETGIANVESQPTGQYTYNLAGQRLSVPQKGINIIGNKKVIVK